MFDSESRKPFKKPNVAALTSGVSSNDGNALEENATCPILHHPPKDYEKFLKYYQLDEWPQRLTSEGILFFDDEDDDTLYTEEGIKQELYKSAPFGLEILDDFGARLDDYADRLNQFANFMTCPEDPLPSRISDGLFHAPKQEFLIKAAASDAVKLHPSHRTEKKDAKQTLQEEAQALKTRNIEYVRFSGFRMKELTELPSQLEAPQILNKVTEAQGFNKGFLQMWKKLFLSEASVAILQDTYWWFFLETFEHNPKAQDRMFTRIADSYIALFQSVHPDVRDKFFKEYPRCLAQAVYLTFYEAFPESLDRFTEEFVWEISSLTSEWIAGIKPPVGDWKKWPWDKLCPRPGTLVRRNASQYDRQMASVTRQTSQKNMRFDINDVIPKSPEDQSRTPQVIISKPVTSTISKSSKRTTIASAKSAMSKVVTTADKNKAISKSSGDNQEMDSALAGPGPDLERVLFNVSGRSPLAAHYLYMKQLRSKESVGRSMKRTEILQEPPPGLTFKDIITKSRKTVKMLNKERERSEQETRDEIAKVRQQHRKTLRQMKEMEEVLTDPIEIKLKSEQVLDEAKAKGFIRFEKDHRILPSNLKKEKR